MEEANNQLLTGSALEASITELMSLGFSRQQVEQALQSSFNNADRAAEYLLSVGDCQNSIGFIYLFIYFWLDLKVIINFATKLVTL